jgi:glutamine synthetase
VPHQHPEEIFDVVDEADRVVGRATRAVVHREGLRHRAAHVFLLNGRGELFLQRRALGKDEHPGLWDSSAAGHLDAGERRLAPVGRVPLGEHPAGRPPDGVALDLVEEQRSVDATREGPALLVEGVGVEQFHPEYSPGQLEISLASADPSTGAGSGFPSPKPPHASTPSGGLGMGVGLDGGAEARSAA